MEIRECDFDKNAEAMILYNGGTLTLDASGGMVTMYLDRHVRIKILKDKGLSYADIHIPFQSYHKNQYIKSLSAQTYNTDAGGNIIISKLDKKLVYEKKIDKRSSEETFSFPDVKPGSIIEYKYTLVGARLNNWHFQHSLPVRYSWYKVDMPIELRVHSTPKCSLPYEQQSEIKGNRDIKTFSMRNIPALRDEAFITCEDDYLQQVSSRLIAIDVPGQAPVDLTGSWPLIIKELMEDEDFGKQLKRNIPRTGDLDSLLNLTRDPYQRMATIHRYVRKNMTWNGYSNIWALDGVKEAWKNKKGTTGEINLILVNLLKDAGLHAHPMLVSTRSHGMVDPLEPSYYQFNKVMAYVTIDNQVYVLDATDPYTPPNMIPYSVMYSQGLVIEKLDTFEGGWKTLWDPKQYFKTVTLVQGEIDTTGTMKGQATLYSYQYERHQRVRVYKNGLDQFRQSYFSSYPQMQMDSLLIENTDYDTAALKQTFLFSQPVSSAGDYQYFSANLFSGLEKNPFVADNRFSDVFFGANQQYQLYTNIRIPDGYSVEGSPKNIKMIMPDTSIIVTRMVSKEANILSCRFTLEFKKPFYSIEEYADFREFYKKLFDLLNEQFVIRKN